MAVLDPPPVWGGCMFMATGVRITRLREDIAGHSQIGQNVEGTQTRRFQHLIDARLFVDMIHCVEVTSVQIKRASAVSSEGPSVTCWPGVEGFARGSLRVPVGIFGISYFAAAEAGSLCRPPWIPLFIKRRSAFPGTQPSPQDLDLRGCFPPAGVHRFFVTPEKGGAK